MSAEDNLSTVKAIYEAFGQGDVDTIVDKLADDVDWSADAASGGAPWYGPRTGKDEVKEFFAAISGAMEVHEFRVVSLAANDDDEVHALIRFRFTANSGGGKASMNIHHYWHFRDGKVDNYRGSEDTAQTLEALGD